MTDPALLSAIDADPACHETLLVLADWLVEREEYEIAKGLRWIVRRGRVPRLVFRCWYTSDVPMSVFKSLRPPEVQVYREAWCDYPTPSAAYLDAAQAAASALRTCCEELWEPGEACVCEQEKFEPDTEIV